MFFQFIRPQVAALAGVLLLAAGCTKDVPDAAPALPVQAQAPPKGELKTGYLAGYSLTYLRTTDGLNRWGDILLTDDQLTASAAGTGGKGYGGPGSQPHGVGLDDAARRWAENTVFYKFSSGLTNAQEIREAMNVWERNTAVRFVEKTDSPDGIYVSISQLKGTGGTGEANLGKVRGGVLRVTADAPRGIICHELGHTLGLMHEMCRSDRDQYLTLHPENWNSNAGNFSTQFAIFMGYTKYGFDYGPFDFDSVMMYDSYAGAETYGYPVITRNDGVNDGIIVQNLGNPSPGDYSIVKHLYPAWGDWGNDGQAGLKAQ